MHCYLEVWEGRKDLIFPGLPEPDIGWEMWALQQIFLIIQLLLVI